MEIKKTKSSIAIVLTFLIAMCVIQCTPKTQIIKEDEEAVLKRRVQEYWSYRIKGEWEKAYLYESPFYIEKINIERYVKQFKRSLTKWEGFEILEVFTTGDEGNVKLRTKYRFLIPETQKAAFEGVTEEKWVKNDRQWYRLSPMF